MTNMEAEIIAVGTELLLGNIANTDAQMLSQGLSAWASMSTGTRWWEIIPSARKRRWTWPGSGRTIIITTGGLGPPATT